MVKHILLFASILYFYSFSFGQTSDSAAKIPAPIVPPTAATYYQNGKTKVSLQDHKGAIKDFTKAIELEPKYANAYYNRAISKNAIEDYRGAVADYTKTLELDPKYMDAYFSRGNSKNAMEDYRGAIADYTKAIELDSRNAKAYYSRASPRASIKDYDGAIADYSKAIELDPTYAAIYVKSVFAKANPQDYKGGTTDNKKNAKEIGLDPKYADTFNKGNPKINIEEYKQLIIEYTKMLKDNPKDAKTYFKRGLLNLSLDQKNNGCLDLSRAGELGYETAYNVIKEYCK